jgi:hypothetical protein
MQSSVAALGMLLCRARAFLVIPDSQRGERVSHAACHFGNLGPRRVRCTSKLACDAALCVTLLGRRWPAQ